ncbi:Lrp/AsnC ligand binding domain-containing protein [Bremerella sp. JC817]|uniref:Lrp/AsnC ligand binding domain-containing protein n=1 Tax=Bremerella sp. JC817 TaxID=3231756 RepID=UPI003459B3E3
MRAYIGVTRRRYPSKHFTMADENLADWANSQDTSKGYRVRKVCTLYGQYDFMIVVEANDLHLLHLVVQEIGSQNGIGDTETFIASSKDDVGRETSLINDPGCVALCFNVDFGYAAEDGIDRIKEQRLGMPASPEAAIHRGKLTKCEHLAETLRNEDRVLFADAVFGKFDVIAIIKEGVQKSSSGEMQTLHQFLVYQVDNLDHILKTATLMNCPKMTNKS